MGTILQAIFTGLFLFIGNKYFSEYVICPDTKTIFIAIILNLVISFVIGLLLVLVCAMVYKLADNAPIVAIIVTLCLLVLGFVFNAFVLFLMSKFIPGLQINGILPYIVYGFICAIIGSATSKSNKTE